MQVAAPRVTAVTYRIDAHDVIVETGGAWHDFARVNGGLPPVLGRPLWHFVSGQDVRAVWALLLRRARTTGRPIDFLYRCDAPGLARVLRMELLPAPDDSLTFRSTQIRTAPATTLAGRRDTGSARAELVVCGWCARVRVDDGWLSADRAVELLGLVEERPRRLSHGICDACARELRSGAGA